MKRLYNILLSAAALLAFAPAIFAQGQWSIDGQIKDPKTGDPLEWPKDNGVHKETDFAYSKDISSPQSDGTYWIKLESFSTGHASYIESAAPADIVLVLDFSTSMDQDYGTPEYTGEESKGYTYSNYNSGTLLYQHTDGTYHQVYVDYRSTGGMWGGGTRYYYLYYQAGNGNNNYYYLNGTQVTRGGRNDYPTNVTDPDTVIWTGVLYTQTGGTRIAALRKAVSDFVDVIYHNDNFESAYPSEETPRDNPLTNRISVVAFSATGNTHQLVGWTSVTKKDGTKDTSIMEAVNSEGTHNYTHSDNGMSIANTLLNSIRTSEQQRWLTSTRTVVLFTDGLPGETLNNWTTGTGAGTSQTVANNCINYAKTAKNDYGAKVFSVALYEWPASTSSYSGAERNMRDYMNYVSSNYQNASSLTNAGTGTYDGSYFKIAGDDLSAVFREIAHQSGGSSTTLSAASSNVDVISNSFILPEGTDTDNIDQVVKIFVAKLEKIENGEYIFYEEILKDHTPDWVDGSEGDPVIDGYYFYPLDEDGERITEVPQKVDTSIRVSFEAPDRIKVTGFDYSSMFCGPVYLEGYEDDDHIDHYQGYKIIIMIPIKMNPDAVGGPDVKTNGPGSGIYVTDGDESAFVAYQSPTVSLPVNIHITKKGLDAGESAKFRIERAILPKEGAVVYDNLTWNYVSTVFVTKSKGTTGDPVVKVRGLPANQDVTIGEGDDATTEHRNFVYRISEEPWSWSYDFNTAPLYTDTDYIDNPFEFENTKKDNIDVKVRHAESKATNIFKPDVVEGNVKYDDSKDNGRDPVTGSKK